MRDAAVRALFVRLLLSALAALAAAGGALLVLGVGPAQVIARVAAAPLTVVLACGASACAMLALQSLRWYLVMRPLLGLGYGQALRAQAVGALLNAILPARGGDIVRAQYLGRLSGKSRAAILGTEVVDRWLDWSAWVPILAFLAPTRLVPRWILGVVALLVVALVVWALVMTIVSAPASEPETPSRIGSIAQAFRSGIAVFASRRTLALALFVAPLPWLWEAAVLGAAAGAVGAHVTYGAAFCVLVGLNVGMLVPSPGGVGGFEAGGAAVLVLFGVDRATALGFLFLYHLTQLVPTMAVGAVFLSLEWRRMLAVARLQRDLGRRGGLAPEARA
jgi:uncharacterized protein (TIRG00374 family)